jgi:3-hydroxyisobutyrate dehydrogenase-like beta-hydroxyacid dehydrogenase
MQIGIAGIGKMGAAIAQRLIEVGHTVTVWNRSAEKLKAVTDAGAKAAATPAALANSAEAVISILTDAAAIDTVYNGASGLLAGDVRGKLFIEMSTVQPQTEVALAEKVRAKGAALVECPVGGSTGPARIMELLSDTSGGPNVLKVRGAGVAAMLKGGDGGPVTFDIDSAVKDLRTMLAEGHERGVELPLVEQTLACYEETKRNVSGAAEVSAVSVYWANRAKQ